ncbi:PREDICTED: uncharacterized protein LOC106302671 [Brassica oleracea var. oleracea]|uniref:uncharacterized protein LOC106302671 n=1 Tax=Brassica oleracea var. oleracea TaxID=109376 RepID=UPI0006A6FA1D|nr:PREDICTED: uncharacterized protein LOC106302671 [Brassica oleracea var. oleracea]
MSDSFEACFTIYYNGKFEINDGLTSYKGGDTYVLVCYPEMMFTKLSDALGISLYGQRIWYKLPYEDITELKMMCNGDAMYQNLLSSLILTKAAQIFLEKDDDLIASGDGDGHSGHGDGSAADGDRVRGDTSHNSDSEMLDEDAQVELNVAGFVDEDEHHNDEVTPQNSDCEDGGRRYQRCKKGSGELKLGQAFDSIPEFKEAVVDYALKSGFNVKFSIWGCEKSEVRCGVVAGGEGDNDGADGNADHVVPSGDGSNKNEDKGCQFRIYCSYEKSAGMFLIKTFQEEHSCIPDGYSQVVRDRIIAKLFLNEIRRDPTLKPKVMQERLEEKYKQYARLKDYKVEVLKCNPDSTMEIGTTTDERGLEVFDRIYVCLAALKRTWIAYCRPIFGIDGCFLKTSVQGQFLAAVGRDSNNQLFPVAWAVVQVENTDSWLWFIQKLKHDLKLLDGTGFTLISDRQKGLINAVEHELPRVEHRMCARHIYGNLRRAYPGKELPKDLFWAVAKSFNIGDYEC